MNLSYSAIILILLGFVVKRANKRMFKLIFLLFCAIAIVYFLSNPSISIKTYSASPLQLCRQYSQTRPACPKLRSARLEDENATLPDDSANFKIFFIETSYNTEMLTNRQVCSIESAAKNNPKARVYVYTKRACATTKMANILSGEGKDLLDIYPNIEQRELDPKELFLSTPLHKWFGNCSWAESPYILAHMSDAARLALLWKYGGFYMDLDTITLRDLRPLTTFSSVGYLFEFGNHSLNNAVMSFEKGHPLLGSIISAFEDVYQPYEWATAGPRLVQKQMHAYCKNDDVFASQLIDKPTFERLVKENEYSPSPEPKWKSFKYSNNESSSNACDVLIYPSSFYSPFTYYSEELNYIFGPDSKSAISKLNDSFLVHLFNQVSSSLKVNLGENSLYEHLAQKHCPTVFSRISNFKLDF